MAHGRAGSLERSSLAALVAAFAVAGAPLPSLASGAHQGLLWGLEKDPDVASEGEHAGEAATIGGEDWPVGAGLGLDPDLLAASLADVDLLDDLALLAAEDIVLSVIRHAQRIEESPAAITVVTREQIRRSGYLDLVEIMRLVPGADVYHMTEGVKSVGLRSRSHVSGEYLLVLIDGRDFAPELATIPLWLGMPADLGSIERVEIIRGPASTLYGANAYQGVVNIVTRRPDEDSLTVEGDAWITAPLGHAANVRAHGSQGKLGWWASVGHDRRRPEGATEPSMEVLRGRAVAIFKHSEDVELTAEVAATSMITAITLVGMGDGTGKAFHPYIRSHARIGRTELLAIAQYQDFEIDVDMQLVLPSDDGAHIPIAVLPAVRHPTLTLNLGGQHHLDLWGGNRLTAGVSFAGVQHMEGSMVRCPEVPFRDFDRADCHPHSELELRAGAFVQDEWQLNKRLTFTGGLRLDYNSLSPELALSPRAALVWRPTRIHALRASYGRAYRKPAYMQSQGHLLLDPQEGAPADLANRLVYIFATGVGNAELRNEKSDSYEIGWRGSFHNGALVGTLDLFHSRFPDAIWVSSNIALQPGFGGVPSIPDDAFLRYFNRPASDLLRSWGGEACLTYQPSKRLELRALYSLDYIFSPALDESTGEMGVKRHLHEPMQRAGAFFRWRPVRAVQVGLDLLWSDSFESTLRHPDSALLPSTTHQLGGSLLLNGSLTYGLELAGGKLEIGVSAINIPDLDIFDLPSTELPNGRLGGDRMGRRVRVFVRGEY